MPVVVVKARASDSPAGGPAVLKGGQLWWDDRWSNEITAVLMRWQVFKDWWDDRGSALQASQPCLQTLLQLGAQFNVLTMLNEFY